MEHLAASDEFRLDMDFGPGVLQCVHNNVMLHARTAFEDWPDPGRRRHLLRLWLSARGVRPLPPVFEERYGLLFDGAPRDGIYRPGEVPRVSLTPG